MNSGRSEITTPLAFGLRAIKGGALVVGVIVEGGESRVVLSTFLATSTEGDRLSLEPYSVAAELTRGPQGRSSAEAASAVAQGRKRQEQLAVEGLHAILQALGEAGFKPLVAALLVNRAGWITDLLAYSVSSPEHMPVAERLAVRDALRFAIKGCGIELAELDEKSLPVLAAETLEMSSMAIEARLTLLGATVGRPWRKEQKLACLAAWFALARQR